jgi:chromosome segregation ATPase
MTTAVVEQDELEQEIEQLDEQIGRARADVAEWENKQREANSLLVELQSSYAEAAAEVVQGRRAPTEKLAKQIDDLREQLLGFGRVITTKREQLSDLQARLQPLQVEKTRIVRGRLVEEERVAVASLIADTECALTDMNELALRFGNGVAELRARKYLDESNRRAAFDAAQSLQRRGMGMRP